MSGLLNFLFSYIVLLVFWFIVNAICYALTIVTRKGFFFIPYALNILISWGIQLYLVFYYLYIIWQIISGREWILLVLILILGGVWIGFWQMVIDFLMVPISGMTIYFSQKAAEKLEDKGEEFDYEVISPEGEVIGKFQSPAKANRLLAKWFLINYGASFLYQFTGNNAGLGPIWFFIFPMVTVVLATIIIGVFGGVWNLIQGRHFLGDDKRNFITSCLKINAIIWGISLVANIL